VAVLRSVEPRRGGAGIALDLGDLRREAEGIVREARERADAILAEARAERERILTGAEDEGRARGHATGLEEGRTAGHAEGRAEALAEMRSSIEAMAGAWNAALDEFIHRREHLASETRRDVVGLGAAIASRVVKRSVLLDPSIVVDQVRGAVDLVMRRTRLVIAVHPEDRTLVEEAWASLAGRFGQGEGGAGAATGGAHAELITDETLGRGSCVVRTEHGEIDADVDRQVQRMVEAMLPHEERSRDADTDPDTNAGSEPGPETGAAPA